MHTKGQKRVVAIHDISCFGKCSLTVALPVLSAAGIETCAIPTAVLSTHTGGFQGYTFRDLTADILPIVQHWKDQKITFDAIYTGYLGSTEQVDLVCQAIDMLKTENTLVIVDPVMADFGRLYANFAPDFPKQMRRLCEKADYIVPNMTEACFLLDRSYHDGPYTPSEIESLLQGLAAIGPASPILTGVYYDARELGAACLEHGVQTYLGGKIDVIFHGTGDVFASALVAALMRGLPCGKAIEIAVEFTRQSILKTLEANPERRYGVNFEAALPALWQMLNA